MDFEYIQTFSVSFDFPVVFTRGLFERGNGLFAEAVTRAGGPRPQRVAVFVDDGVVRGHPGLVGQVGRYFAERRGRMELAAEPEVVPGGEAIKGNLDLVHGVVARLIGLELCRHSTVVAIGGGAVLDAIGFATALPHRGLRLVRVPTTVLAQNDVGVGVKNAMNFGGGKNAIGTFSPPFAVLNDFNFLRTLSDRDWIGGISEAFKVAIIRDAGFFDALCRDAGRLRAREEGPMEKLIRRCAELHLQHIRGSGDPFEFGRARPLDFGHWAAHKLEQMSGYRIGHGQAVAAGIALDSAYAVRKGWLTAEEFARIVGGLEESGLPLWYDELERRGSGGQLEILRGVEAFRQHLGGELFVTFPDGIGRRQETQEIDAGLVEQVVADLRARRSST